jgi:hypothetical protein
MSRDISIAIGRMTEQLGFNCQQSQAVFSSSQQSCQSWDLPNLLYNGHQWPSPVVNTSWGITLTTHLHLDLRVKIRGAMPPLFHTSSWYTVTSLLLPYLIWNIIGRTVSGYIVNRNSVPPRQKLSRNSLWESSTTRTTQLFIAKQEHVETPDKTVKNGVFWDVMPCGSCKNRRFGGAWRLLHQGDKNRWTRNNTSCN